MMLGMNRRWCWAWTGDNVGHDQEVNNVGYDQEVTVTHRWWCWTWTGSDVGHDQEANWLTGDDVRHEQVMTLVMTERLTASNMWWCWAWPRGRQCVTDDDVSKGKLGHGWWCLIWTGDDVWYAYALVCWACLRGEQCVTDDAVSKGKLSHRWWSWKWASEHVVHDHELSSKSQVMKLDMDRCQCWASPQGKQWVAGDDLSRGA